MANGDKRRNRKRQSKRYRVRYDRIAAVVLVLIVLIVIITSCAKSCSGNEDKPSDSEQTQTTSTEPQQQSSIVDNLEVSSDFAQSSGSTVQSTVNEGLQFTTETHSFADVRSGDLVLVNSSHEYFFPDGDIDPVTLYDHISTDSYNVSDYVTMLDSSVLDQLNGLMDAFYAAHNNNDIYIIGGYRTLEEQNDKYYSGSSDFMGGYTDYHTARSFDMGIFPKDGSSSGYYSATGIYSWIDENAAEYGFILRFPEGKEESTGVKTRAYTYRYVGVPHAVYISRNDLCLEEYIAEIKEHNNNDPLDITVGDKVYKVYFAASDGTNETDIPVPVNKTYTVSGNNEDGFIVTVSMN